jgi:hypothetical protein
MINVGEETTTDHHSDGEVQIKSRGLSVYIEEERITFDEQGRWHNANGSYGTLHLAVKEALSRHERSKSTRLHS